MSGIFESAINKIKSLIESKLDIFDNQKYYDGYEKSDKWCEWRLGKNPNHCKDCVDRERHIFARDESVVDLFHVNCKCKLVPARRISIGFATKRGIDGADYHLHNYGKLLNYYISKEEAEASGWVRRLGNLAKIAPGKMIGGDVYDNVEKKLPSNRIWHECDIDYESGYRNDYRLVYSNDGLIFKTEDHYKSFIVVE